VAGALYSASHDFSALHSSEGVRTSAERESPVELVGIGAVTAFNLAVHLRASCRDVLVLYTKGLPGAR